MFNKSNAAFAIALPIALAAPASAFAQTIFIPTTPGVQRPGDIARAPYGGVVGRDPDPGIRYELRRDWDRNR
jgi:hypothetical protein